MPMSENTGKFDYAEEHVRRIVNIDRTHRESESTLEADPENLRAVSFFGWNESQAAWGEALNGPIEYPVIMHKEKRVDLPWLPGAVDEQHATPRADMQHTQP